MCSHHFFRWQALSITMNCDFHMNFPIQRPMAQCNTTQNNNIADQNLSSLMMSNNASQNFSISHKLYKTGLYITSANIPPQMKTNLIQNLLSQNTNITNCQTNQKTFPPVNKFYNINLNKSHFNHNNSGNPRVLFKKEEDERIKKLVKIFGTRHWDLVAQFMEGRTAKQCRDRYSNYLIPGFFQGEWSDEEDSLLVKLYKENGPRWSVIQKSFKNRSANNIKNRWYYFLHKKVESAGENTKLNENYDVKSCLELNDKIDEQLLIPDQNNETAMNEMNFEKDQNDNNIDFLFNENDIYDCYTNIETENNWLLFN